MLQRNDRKEETQIQTAPDGPQNQPPQKGDDKHVQEAFRYRTAPQIGPPPTRKKAEEKSQEEEGSPQQNDFPEQTEDHLSTQKAEWSKKTRTFSAQKQEE